MNYKLLKDLPGVKAGIAFIRIKFRDKAEGYVPINNDNPYFLPNEVENNPEWFAPVEKERVDNRDWIVPDLWKKALNKGWKIMWTSCGCGGNAAWLKPRPSGAYEMFGCTCHCNPVLEKKEKEAEPQKIESGINGILRRAKEKKAEPKPDPKDEVFEVADKLWAIWRDEPTTMKGCISEAKYILSNYASYDKIRAVLAQYPNLRILSENFEEEFIMKLKE